MKILLVTHYWLPHPGGIEYLAREQAMRLTQRGHFITAVTSAIGDSRPVSRDDGFDVHRIPANNFLERKLGVPYPLFSLALFAHMTRLAEQHDVVLAHSHTFMSSVAAAMAAQRARKPLVAIQHNPHIQYPFPLNGVYAGADAILGRYTLGSAARLLAVSKHTAAYAQTLAPRKPVEVLYNGVDTQKFTPVSADEKSAIRQRLGLPPDEFVALTVRRLFYRNGVDVLIRACALLKDQKDVHVFVGGKGPDRPAMEKFIAENGLANTHLLGFIPDEDLVDYFRAADVFVLPTRTGEGFGLVIAEANACGVPVIATRSGAPEEIVQDGITGLLVPPENPAALADAITQLRRQPDLRREMGRAARLAAEKLDWERNVDQLEQILNSELGSQA